MNGVGYDLQRHRKCQHNHVVDHQMDVQHIPAAGRSAAVRAGDTKQPDGFYCKHVHVCDRKKNQEITRGPLSPGVSLEDLALKVGVHESSVDAVDDRAESKGDEVL